MNIEEIRDYCLSKKFVTEEFPFDETTLVFKLYGKMFALTNLDGETMLTLKCDPEKAILLREEFSYVVPGYHMNKNLWNSIYTNEVLDSNLLKKWIDDSYELVLNKLPKKYKELMQ